MSTRSGPLRDHPAEAYADRWKGVGFAALSTWVWTVAASGGIALLTTGLALGGPPLQLEQEAVLRFRGISGPWLDGIALEVTALGGTLVASVIILLVATPLLLLGRRPLGRLLILGAGGAMLLSPALKALVDRPRPTLESPVPFVVGSAFPSGHAMVGAATFLLLAFAVHRLGGGRRTVSIAFAAAAFLLVTLIGISRVYLGVHYPLDVVGGVAYGLTWAGACILVLLRREDRAVRATQRRTDSATRPFREATAERMAASPQMPPQRSPAAIRPDDSARLYSYCSNL